MKHVPSQYSHSKCFSCGGPVISGLEINEERKNFIYGNTKPDKSLPKNTTSIEEESCYGFFCKTCCMFYIFPPPLDKEHWDTMAKIFLNSLKKEGGKKTETAKKKEKTAETELSTSKKHTSSFSKKRRRQRPKPQLPKAT
jgi:hypothetical protein